MDSQSVTKICSNYYTPIFNNKIFSSSTLSQHTLNFLQCYCEMRNACAKETPELFQDEPFKVLTIDNLTLSHIKSAIEIEEEGISCGMEIDMVAISELLNAFIEVLS